MLLIGVGYGLAITAINVAAFAGTRRGEEGPIGLAVLLTVANFETSEQVGWPYTLRRQCYLDLVIQAS
jgi:hypothetical protein